MHAELYSGLGDALHGQHHNVDGAQIGKKVILPSSFTGSARYQHQLYQDAMAVVWHYGKTDLFITFTFNPRWEEITGAPLDNQSPCDRPDIVAHIFKLKLQALLHDLHCGHYPVFGKMSTLIYVVEWQERGPPHVHILAICDPVASHGGQKTMIKLFVQKYPIAKLTLDFMWL